MEWRELSSQEMRNREKRGDKPPFMVCKRSSIKPVPLLSPQIMIFSRVLNCNYQIGL